MPAEPIEIVDVVVRARRQGRPESWEPIDISSIGKVLVPRTWMTKSSYNRLGLAGKPSLELIELAEEALWTDLELVTDVWLTLRATHRRRALSRLNRLLARNRVRPIPWLEDARSAVNSLPRMEPGDHHVYVILLGGYGPRGLDYGAYVGETAKAPALRFMQHLARGTSKRGKRLWSGDVARRGIELLPSVSSPLAMVNKDAAKEAEALAASALRRLRIPVEGGH